MVTPHIAVNGALSKLGRPRRTVLDRHTVLHECYASSQRHRKRIKAQAGFPRAKVRGLAKVDAVFTMMAAAYKLRRLAGLAATAS